MKHRFAVLGAGNGGQTLAAHLTLLGCEVSLYDTDREKLQQLVRRGSITLSGKLEVEVRLHSITESLAKAVQGREGIFVTTTTDQHIAIAKALAPLVQADQLVILCPGQTGGSIVFRNLLLAAGKDIPVAETQDLLYACRATAPGQVAVSALKLHMAMAVLPASAQEQAFWLVNQVFPQIYPAKGVLEIGFDNTGAMLHPAPMLLNAGRVEAGEPFLYYKSGITPSVAAVVEKLDQERLAVAAAYGIAATSLNQWLENTYGVQGKDLYERLQNNAAYAAIKAGAVLNCRFLTEDVPSGLVPLAELGRVAGVDTPTINGVIALADSLLGRDFLAEGRNLKCLGVEGLSTAEIRKLYQ